MKLNDKTVKIYGLKLNCRTVSIKLGQLYLLEVWNYSELSPSNELNDLTQYLWRQIAKLLVLSMSSFHELFFEFVDAFAQSPMSIFVSSCFFSVNRDLTKIDVLRQIITKNAKMKYVKLFWGFHWPGNTQIYASIAESMFLFLRKFYIAQHFAQLRLGTKQRTQFFRENKYLKNQEEVLYWK